MFLLKRALLVTVVFALAWIGAIAYWRQTPSQPDNTELAILLLAVPLSILLLCWLGAVLASRLLAASPGPVAPTASASDTATTATPPQAAPPLVLVASALRVPHGNCARELAGAMADSRRKAGLDPELVDADGYPIMAARVAAADDPALQLAMQRWQGVQRIDEVCFSDEQWRALTLASAVTTELGQRVAQHAGLAAMGEQQQSVAPPQLPALQILLLWQTGWSAEQRAIAAFWLRHLVAREGWPADRIAMDPELAGEPSNATTAALLARLSAQHRSGHPVLALAIACGSHISDASVSRWAASNELHTPAQGQGKMPGEGAAGLLLADPVQAQLLGSALPVLVRSAEGQRQASIDASKRTDASVLRILTDLVLADSATDAAQVALLVADTGNRSNRVMETMGLAGALLPQLDTGDELLQVGAVSGTCGAVPFVSALALAAWHSAELRAPVLCLSNEDPQRRCSALLWPAPAAAPALT